MNSDNIHVAVRVRPLIAREEKARCKKHWQVEENSIFQVDAAGKALGSPFAFDRVYDCHDTTMDVYQDMAGPIAESVIQGFNGSIFAYGQTSSGKTYTMMGDQRSPGIIGLTVDELFDIIENTPDRIFLLRVSYMEIYNETISDLLSEKKRNLKIHENRDGMVYVADLKEQTVNSPEQILAVIEKGEKNRRFGVTNMNEQSSRSHAIFQMIIESRKRDAMSDSDAVTISHLNLVDLAGSERSSQTRSKGERFKEGCHINLSLLTLSQVISSLSEGQSYINFRGSSLTRILQSSLGGNARTVIICNITPAEIEQTCSTLKFASRAKKIKNKPLINEVLSDEALLKQHNKKISQLMLQLEEEKGEKKSKERLLQEKVRHNEKLEEEIRKLREKLVVSSSIPLTMTFTPNASIAKQKKSRRETWCAPSIMKKRRFSVALNLGRNNFEQSFAGSSEHNSTLDSQASPNDSITTAEMPSSIGSYKRESEIKVSERLLQAAQMSPIPAVECRRRRQIRWFDSSSPDEVKSDDSEKLKKMECDLSFFKKQNEEAWKQNSQLTTAQQSLQHELNSLKKEYAELEEFTRLESQINIETRQEVISEENEQLKTEIDDLKAERKSRIEKLKQLEPNVRQREKISELKQQRDSLTVECKRLIDVESKFQILLSESSPVAQQCVELDIMRTELETLLMTNNNLTSRAREDEEELRALQLKNGELLSSVQANLGLTEEINSLKMKIEELQMEKQRVVDECEQFSEIESKFQSLRMENESMKIHFDELNAIKTKFDALCDDKRDLIEKCDTFEEIIRSLNAENLTKDEKIQGNGEELQALKSECNGLKAELESHVQAGDVQEELNCLKARIEKINLEKQLVADECKRLNEIELKFQSLMTENELTKMQVVELNATKTEFSALLDEKQDLIEKCGSFEETIRSLNAENVSNAQKIQASDEEILALQSLNDKLKSECNGLMAELESSTQTENAQEEVNRLKARIEELQVEKQRVLDECERFNEIESNFQSLIMENESMKVHIVEINAMKAKFDALCDDKRGLMEKCDTFEETIRNLNVENATKDETIQGNNEELQVLKSLNVELKSECNSLKDKLENRVQAEDANKEVTCLKARIEEMLAEKQKILQECERLIEIESKFQCLMSENESVTMQCVELNAMKSEFDVLQDVRRDLLEKCNVFEKTISSLNAKNDMKTKEMQVCNEELRALQLLNKELESECIGLKSKLENQVPVNDTHEDLCHLKAKIDEVQLENRRITQESVRLVEIESKFKCLMAENEHVTMQCIELNAVRMELDELRDDKRNLIEKSKTLEDSLKELHAEHSSKIQKMQVVNEELQALQQLNGKLKSECLGLKAELEHHIRADDAQESNHWKTKMEEIRVEKQLVLDECDNLQNDRQDLIEKCKAFEETINKLQVEMQKNQAEAEGLQALQLLNNELKSECLELKSELENRVLSGDNREEMHGLRARIEKVQLENQHLAVECHRLAEIESKFQCLLSENEHVTMQCIELNAVKNEIDVLQKDKQDLVAKCNALEETIRELQDQSKSELQPMHVIEELQALQLLNDELKTECLALKAERESLVHADDTQDEMNHLKAKIEEMELEKQRICAEYDRLAEIESTHITEVDAIRAELDELRDDRRNLIEKCDTLEESIRNLRAENFMKTENLQVSDEELRALQLLNSKLESECLGLKAELNNHVPAEEMDNLKAKIEELLQEKQRIVIEYDRLADLEPKYQHLFIQNEEQRTELDKLRRDRQNLMEKCDTFEEAAREMRPQFVNVEIQTDEECNALDLQHVIDSLKLEKGSLRNEIAQLEQENEVAIKNMIEKYDQEKADALKAQQMSMEHEVLNNIPLIQEQARAELQAVHAEEIEAIKTNISNRYELEHENLKVEMKTNYDSMIDNFKTEMINAHEEELDRVNILLEKAKDVEAGALNKVKEVEAINQELEDKIADCAAKIELLKNEIVEGKAAQANYDRMIESFKSEMVDANEKEVESINRELDKVKAANVESAKLLENTRMENEALQASLNKVQEVADEATKSWKESIHTVAMYRSREVDLEAKINNMGPELDELKSLKNDLESKVADGQLKIDEMHAKLKRWKERYENEEENELLKKSNKLVAEVDKLELQIEKLYAEKTESLDHVAKLEASQEIKDKELKDQAHRIGMLLKQAENHAMVLTDLREQINSSDNQNEILMKKVEELEKLKESLQGEIEAQSQVLEKNKAEIDDLRSEIKNKNLINDKLAEYKSEIQNLEEELARKERNYKELDDDLGKNIEILEGLQEKLDVKEAIVEQMKGELKNQRTANSELTNKVTQLESELQAADIKVQEMGQQIPSDQTDNVLKKICEKLRLTLQKTELYFDINETDKFDEDTLGSLVEQVDIMQEWYEDNLTLARNNAKSNITKNNDLKEELKKYQDTPKIVSKFLTSNEAVQEQEKISKDVCEKLKATLQKTELYADINEPCNNEENTLLNIVDKVDMMQEWYEDQLEFVRSCAKSQKEKNDKFQSELKKLQGSPKIVSKFFKIVKDDASSTEKIKDKEEQKDDSNQLKHINGLYEETVAKNKELKEARDKAQEKIMSISMKTMDLERALYKQEDRNELLKEENARKDEKISDLKKELRRTQNSIQKDSTAVLPQQDRLAFCGGGSGIVQSTMIEIQNSKIVRLERELAKFKSKEQAGLMSSSANQSRSKDEKSPPRKVRGVKENENEFSRTLTKIKTTEVHHPPLHDVTNSPKKAGITSRKAAEEDCKMQ